MDGHQETRIFVGNLQSSPYEDAPMHTDYMHQPPLSGNERMEQMLQAMLIQMNNTNQALIAMLSQRQDCKNRPDPKVRPKPFSGLPTEDVLTWLDHFDNVAECHQWSDEHKALEARTLYENIAATWFMQQDVVTKQNWAMIRGKLVENFAHQDVAQTALQQLQNLRQQHLEPVG